MPIQHAIWKVGGRSALFFVTKLAFEKKLEDMITSRPGILSNERKLLNRRNQRDSARQDLLE